MFLAIDRVSKLVYVKFHPTAEMATGGAFMRHVFDRAGDEHGIEHRLTNPAQPFQRCCAPPEPYAASS